MKAFRSVFLFLFAFATNGYSQLRTFYIKPHSIDTSYSAAQDSNYIAVNSSAADNGKLLVFLDGSGSATKDYTYFPKLAANLGYHAISVAYPNTPTISSSCAWSADSLCFDNLRQQVCYGTNVSSHSTVDTFNCIYTRMVKLLAYLATNYPGDGWAQFLSAGVPAWSKFVMSGHSQGSGHALYFGKTQACNRIIMFSGADDYSDYFGKPAHWIYSSFRTSKTRFYSFLHLRDDVVSYAKQYAIIQALGMTAADDSTDVDNKSVPYDNSHCLYTNAEPQHAAIYSSYHDATAVDFFTPLNTGTGGLLYDSVWTYMLTPLATGINNINTPTEKICIYPNPASGYILVYVPNALLYQQLQLINALGEVLVTTPINSNTIHVNVYLYPSGVYYVRIGDKVLPLIKQ